MKITIGKILIVLVLSFVFLLTAIFIYLIVTKPFGINILSIPGALIQAQSNEVKTTSDNPLLTPAQDSLLQSIGVDTAALPTSITEAQLSCFAEQLGAARMQEIEAGSTITLSDFLKAKVCVE